MSRPSKLVRPRGEPIAPPQSIAVEAIAVEAIAVEAIAVEAIAVEAIVLPPPLPRLTRSEIAGAAVAGALHLALLGAFLSPEHRLGIGGTDPDAIGIDIVTFAPALDARTNARGRDAAAADRAVSENDGDARPAEEETPARDSLSDDRPLPETATPPPADLAVPEWIEPQRVADAPATEPIIARAKADGAAPDTPEREQAAAPDQPSSSVDSRSATEVLARFHGGAAARGRDAVELSPLVMAAARAGQRNDYKLAIYRAISLNQPRGVAGQSGSVKVEFTVLPDGLIGEARVAGPSNSRQLDEAAVAAIAALRLPPPPPILTSEKLVYDLVFTFK